MQPNEEEEMTFERYRYTLVNMGHGKSVPQRRRRIIKYITIILFILLIVLFLGVFVIVPVVFKYSIEFQRLLMFTNIGLPSERKDFELVDHGERNFYIDYKDYDGKDISLGVWHIVPDPIKENEVVDFDAALNSTFATVVHFHGSGETRRDSQGMFRVLSEIFNVVAFDTRDFGDSTKSPISEEKAVLDALQVINWVRNKTNSEIYIWGHSLGASIASHTVQSLKKVGYFPAGLVLEAPFTTMREEIPVHPYGKIFAWLPWFTSTILDPLEQNGFLFESSKYILNVDCPIMILHAEDDSIIPYTLGKKLTEIARSNRQVSQGPVYYYQFPAEYGFDHFRIYLSPDLPILIRSFSHYVNMTEESATGTM